MSLIDELFGDEPPLPKRVYTTDGIPPGVVTLFEKLAWELINAGFKRHSARAIMHRIRWHYQVEQRQLDFKCNNNWTPLLSRWFMDKHHMHGFFEIRASPSKHDMRGYAGPYKGDDE